MMWNCVCSIWWGDIGETCSWNNDPKYFHASFYTFWRVRLLSTFISIWKYFPFSFDTPKENRKSLGVCVPRTNISKISYLLEDITALKWSLTENFKQIVYLFRHQEKNVFTSCRCVFYFLQLILQVLRCATDSLLHMLDKVFFHCSSQDAL